MPTTPSKPARFTAARAKGAIAFFDRKTRIVRWASIAGICLLAAFSVIFLARLRASAGVPTAASGSGMLTGGTLLMISAFGISIVLIVLGTRAQRVRSRRLARRVILHRGSLCMTCHSPLPFERPLALEDSRSCCRDTAELFNHDELQDWWEMMLSQGGQHALGAWQQGRLQPPTPGKTGRRRLIWLCVLQASLCLAIPLLVTTLSALFGRTAPTAAGLTIEALSNLPHFLSLASIMIGFQLAAAGFGWSLERGPFCARCGYSWHQGSAAKCPECGAYWNGPGGRRTHRTRPNRALLATGLILAIAGLAASFGGFTARQGTLLPSSMLIANIDYRASYCPRARTVVDRTLTAPERRDFALRTIAALEGLFDDLSRGVENASVNYSAVEWLAAEVNGVHGPVDPKIASLARSLMVPLEASAIDRGIRLEGRGTYTPLRSGGGTLLIAVEVPDITPLAESATALPPSRRWGDPIGVDPSPVDLARSGRAHEFAVDKEGEWRRVDVPFDMPTLPGRYLVRICHWIVFDPMGSLRSVEIRDGVVVAPIGGWAERYEHRFVIEVPPREAADGPGDSPTPPPP